MDTHIALRKEHRCDMCGRRIPIGARYFYLNSGRRRQHTNCLDYENQPMLPFGFNANRRAGRTEEG